MLPANGNILLYILTTYLHGLIVCGHGRSRRSHGRCRRRPTRSCPVARTPAASRGPGASQRTLPTFGSIFDYKKIHTVSPFLNPPHRMLQTNCYRAFLTNARSRSVGPRGRWVRSRWGAWWAHRGPWAVLTGWAPDRWASCIHRGPIVFFDG